MEPQLKSLAYECNLRRCNPNLVFSMCNLNHELTGYSTLQANFTNCIYNYCLFKLMDVLTLNSNGGASTPVQDRSIAMPLVINNVAHEV